MRIGIITGASSGMGREFVKRAVLDSPPCDELWLIARRKERLAVFPNLYKKQKFRLLSLDLSREEDLKVLAEKLDSLDEKDHVALFIHSAGFGLVGDIRDMSPEKQGEMVDLNCRSVAELTAMVLPHMEEGAGGRMIYMASAAAFLPQPGFALYAASKAFVLSYVRSLRAENRGRGLRITAVCPGSVKTEFLDKALEGRSLPFYKKMVMADPVKVVAKAWKDNKKNRELSVYGIPIKATRLAAGIIPHAVFLRLMGSGKKKGPDR